LEARGEKIYTFTEDNRPESVGCHHDRPLRFHLRCDSGLIRAQKNILIAQEYINRKLYMQADAVLDTLRGHSELSEYLDADGKAAVARLDETIKAALAARSRIADNLRESDELAAAGEFIQASERLLAIRDSEYLREMERKQIVQSLAALEPDVKAQTERIQTELDAAVELYRQGDTDKARQALEKIAQSGGEVRSSEGKTAGELIAMIDRPVEVKPETEAKPEEEKELKGKAEAEVEPEAVEITPETAVEPEPAESTTPDRTGRIDVENELLGGTETVKETTATEATEVATETEEAEPATETTEAEAAPTETEAATEPAETDTAATTTETEVVVKETPEETTATETTEVATETEEAEPATETTEAETAPTETEAATEVVEEGTATTDTAADKQDAKNAEDSYIKVVTRQRSGGELCFQGNQISRKSGV